MKIASNLHIIYYPSSFAPTLIDWKLVIGFKMWITKPEISWCLNQCNNKYRVQLSALAPTTSFATFWAFLKNNKVSYVLKILQAHIFSTSTSSESFWKKTLIPFQCKTTSFHLGRKKTYLHSALLCRNELHWSGRLLSFDIDSRIEIICLKDGLFWRKKKTKTECLHSYKTTKTICRNFSPETT